MRCLYVCIKDVIAPASGYDSPHYLKWPVGSVAWFPTPPDKEYWEELIQYTAVDTVFTFPNKPERIPK